MKKLSIFACVLVVLILFTAVLAYSQSLEQIKASVRAQVRQEMGLDQPERSPSPAQQSPRRQETKKTAALTLPKLNTVQQIMLILAVIAFVPATIAKMKGRSFIAWWVLGFLCFIVVIPAAVYMKKIETAPDMRSL